MSKYPIKKFRLEHGYSFDQSLKGPEILKDNFYIGSILEDRESIEAVFLGKLAEFENMKANVWLGLQGAHAIYIMGKRRSGKSFTLGVIAENLVSSQWIKQGSSQQAVLILDTLNIFITMPHRVPDVYGKGSKECEELLKWGLEDEILPIKLFYPRGSSPPPEGDCEELALRASDLSGEDWASLFGVDTFSEPTGQLIAELYDKVALEGYTNNQGDIVPPNTTYNISDLLQCLEDDPQVDRRFETKTIGAVRRRLQAINRIPLFAKTGINIRDIFKSGCISVVLLRNIDDRLRGLLIGIMVKQIMEQRSLADQYERLAEVYLNKSQSLSEKNPLEAEEAQKQYQEYAMLAKAGLPRGWIIIDEAHNYLPSRGIIASREPLKKYVNEGRNLGLSIVVATQHPSGLDPAIQRNADILIIHSMSMSDDIQTAERMINTFVPESIVYDNQERISSRLFEKLVRSLDLGYAVISNDNMNRVFPVKIRPRITIHGGKKY